MQNANQKQTEVVGGAIKRNENGSSGVYSLAESSPSRPRTISDIKRDFQLGDVIDFVHQGLEVNF